jgi:ADP-dependent NAD(P)H-hydrate dehydratase
MQWSRRVAEAVPLDSAWLKAHPLPTHQDDVDKNRRGSVLVIGGSRSVPGGIVLTAEAAFRAGAGKVTIATIASAAPAIGIAMPECGIVAMPETQDGEIAVDDGLCDRLSTADSIVLGPCMTANDPAGALLALVLDHAPADTMLVLDAAAIRSAPAHKQRIADRQGATIMTPHGGEMAALLGIDAEAVADDPIAGLTRAASHFAATVMAKGATSSLRHGDQLLSYAGGGIGLATGGSGDVLAGIIGSLAAQGAGALEATAWGIWLHGEAGRRLAETMGPIGFLARELLPLIPQIMQGVRQ